MIGMSLSESAAPLRFVPRLGASEWWVGNPASLALVDLHTAPPALVTQRHLLDARQCQLLIAASERIAPRRDANPFWDGRCATLDMMPDSEREARALLQQVRLITQLTIIQKVRPPYVTFGDTTQLVRWDPGQGLTPHADNIEPDGRPNGTPHRAFSAIVYLNDDYGGGETYFPGLGVRLKPEAGGMVAFGSGASHVHGVTPVRDLSRFMIAMWFTFDKSKVDPVQFRAF